MPRGSTPEVEAAIVAAIEAARAAEREGGWVTYLARDLRRLDIRGNRGWPIYVGQSTIGVLLSTGTSAPTLFVYLAVPVVVAAIAVWRVKIVHAAKYS